MSDLTVNANTDALVRVEGLGVEIHGRPILEDVGFTIPVGGALALVGESGSGKTVTSRVLTGLLTRIGGSITSGSATIDGEDVTALSEDAWGAMRGHKIALVPQASLSSLDPVMRIGRQLVETIRNLEPGEPNPGRRAVELLDLVRLPRAEQLLRAYPHELSGGMRQRVMIALALAGSPRLIVADEPTTALDVTVQKGILNLLGDIRRDTGMTLMIVAHDLAVVSEVAESIAVMHHGRIVESGTARQVLSSPADEYTRALIAARPEGAEPGTPLAVLDTVTGVLRTPDVPHRRILSQVGPPVLELEQVGMRFRRSPVLAVEPVDVSVRAGEAVGIVGESGSGKTTLGRIMVGALHPTMGTVKLDGADWSTNRQIKALRKDVQMIFQDPYGSLTPWLTPRDIVAQVIRRWNKITWREARTRAGALLDEVGLQQEAFDQLPVRLSGGQCQRVGIARALASEPRLLVADEPTSSLDVSVQAQILNLLMRLRAERGLALVLISHDLGVVRHMTDRALVMKSGAVVEQGPTSRLLDEPESEYTRSLVDSTPLLASINGK